MTTPNPLTGTIGTISTPASIITSQNSIVTTVTPVDSSGGSVNILCLTGINNKQNQIPSEFKLCQNYPNPFNPTTKIKFELPLIKGAKGMKHLVTLSIFDILGREVVTLVNEKLYSGTYEITWDAGNYPSGVYFYRLMISNLELSSVIYFIESKRMVLLK